MSYVLLVVVLYFCFIYYERFLKTERCTLIHLDDKEISVLLLKRLSLIF